MKSAQTLTIVIVLIVAFGAAIWFMTKTVDAPTTVPTNTTSGTDTPDTSVVGTELARRIVIDAPKSGAVVPKAFTVTGKAPGSWYFEASFPIQIHDANNNKVGQGIATALSDWMTTGDVAFKADITIDSYTGPATLVLIKDNPSGLPEYDDSVSIPIVIQ
jgi:hypothetical protein